MRLRIVVLAGLLSGLGWASGRVGWAQESPGIVKDKPASGPFVTTPRGFLVPYRVTIPGTQVTFDMMPIPGGKSRIGSADGEPGRDRSEGPAFDALVPPGWMAKCEVSWAEYKTFMGLYQAFKKFQSRNIRAVTDNNRADAITAPTELYDPSFTFEYGEDPRQPAVTMTQYAAKQYSKWMSAITGQFYRLPSEAEWEHACRAGSTTRYSFGDEPAALGEHAWFAKNAPGRPAKIGEKKPNAWGLHDMHGNVAEWVLDELLKDGYTRFGGRAVSAAEAVVWPKKPFPRVVKGGSWESEAAACRSAARLGSHDIDWKGQDPNLPLSPWWFTDDPARGVGFRLYRPLDAPAADQRGKYWDADIEATQEDVQARLREGRGVLGIVDPALPEALKNLKE